MAEHVKKEGNAFVKLFVPNKNDNKGAFIRKIVVLIALVVAIICGLFILAETADTQADIQMNNTLEEIFVNNASGNFSIAAAKVEEIKEEVPNIMEKFVELYAENSDIIGWIKVGHYINYPVLMNENETDYYLYRNFNKQDSQSGSIFCDNHVQPFQDANNLVIYGHNMMSGEYFATLTAYDPYANDGGGGKGMNFINYYKTYPTVQFDTLYEEGTYKIFAGIYINTEDVDGYPYPYYRKRQFKNEYEFMDFMGNIMDRSTFYTDVDVEYGDQIITLSTCCYTIGKDVDARFAVFARKVRDGESPEVDVEKIQINPDPLFFDAYYARRGGSWGGRNWDISLVKDFDKYNDQIDSLDNLEPGEVPATTTAAE